MAKLVVYADFHNADSGGRIRLNCIGTTQDLARLGVRLREGLEVTLHDEELQAEGKVQYSDEERFWVATIDWGAIHQTVYIDVYIQGETGELPEAGLFLGLSSIFSIPQ